MTGASDAVGCLSPSVAMLSRKKTSQREPAHDRTCSSWHAWIIPFNENHLQHWLIQDMPQDRKGGFHVTIGNILGHQRLIFNHTNKKQIPQLKSYLKYVKIVKYPKYVNFSSCLPHQSNILRTRHVKKCLTVPLLTTFCFLFFFFLII